jgi:hypothetical protein
MADQSNRDLNANGSGQTADLVAPFKLTHGKPLRTGATCAPNDLSCHYFDPTSFGAPLITSAANAHYGNTNRDEFRGPGYFNMNLSIIRDFKLTERLGMQFRADAFGLTNTPHFANPGTGCAGTATDPTLLNCNGFNPAKNTFTSNNFGVITGTASPGGFFGPDSGARTIWFGASLKF